MWVRGPERWEWWQWDASVKAFCVAGTHIDDGEWAMFAHQTVLALKTQHAEIERLSREVARLKAALEG